MKKVLITLAMVFIVITSNAQWFLGGDVGLHINEDKTKTANEQTFKSSVIGFTIAPKSGYYFNEKFALGLSFSVGVNFINASDVVYYMPDGSYEYQGHYKEISIPWRINPFVRFSVFTHKRFSVILEGSIGVGGKQFKGIRTYSESGYKQENKYSTIGIGVLNITPILGFTLSDHFQLEAGLNFLNLGYNIDIKDTKIGGEGSKTRTVKHDFNIGFNTSSILVMSQLTIGVIYKF